MRTLGVFGVSSQEAAMDDDKGRFGFEPEDFEHVIRDATEGLREALGGFGRFFTTPGERAGWSSVFEDLSRRTRTRPETAGEAGDGVWAIYMVSADGGALRANRNNTDATRKVRFLPYGIAVSVLDDSDEAS
jgi:hypothetical protein